MARTVMKGRDPPLPGLPWGRAGPGHTPETKLGLDGIDCFMTEHSTATGNWPSMEGTPEPRGASYFPSERAFNFSLYSRHAQGVSLLLFTEDELRAPLREIKLDRLRNRTGNVWHCRVSELALKDIAYYGYRVFGPWAPEQGLRFDPDKVLLDPYAQRVFHPPGCELMATASRGSTLGIAPLAEIPRPRPAFDWGEDRRPQHTSDLIIYEMHVRGFTRHSSSGVAQDRRGTFAGIIDKIPYLVELGVTAIELLPVHQFDPGTDGNYWGYMTMAFFAPHGSYCQSRLPAEQLDEFRTMVKALHEADIEVILDVVYNHTAEHGADGPFYCFRGIDNPTYYLLGPKLSEYRNDTGAGNVLRTAHPTVRRLIVDSLRFWVEDMHVDGFRFDLATILSRDLNGNLITDRGSPIFNEIVSDPTLREVRLIAEPWDVAAFQLGYSFPACTWYQWNGRFRDDVRRFVKSDPGMVPSLMRRLYGSDDLFPDSPSETYRAFQSINFVTAHDGFCLYDLVSYTHKRNHANGRDNTDGSDDNHSWNCGYEGDDPPPEVATLRKRQIKNLCALLLLSNGTPMILAGDEFMNTQRGNNNPYNQDNPTSWLDWSLAKKNADMLRFWQCMIRFRRRHASLQRSHFYRRDVSWFGTDGAVDTTVESRCLAMYLTGQSLRDGDLYLMVNAFWQPQTFRIGAPEGPSAWRRVLDTGLDSPDDFADGEGDSIGSDEYTLVSRSVALLLRG